ncbi:hypothetical protein BD626DRAFT_488399 [Schizophyllum amplum]|uniref:Uncharacterized protein n=2 Tax=Schizophyllum amplum TaxID=97359 RepID=A0A550CKM8_9AGAR|nr:hypothetical protein BD626DRAFT_488399 [Auriculariopsis ampla]
MYLRFSILVAWPIDSVLLCLFLSVLSCLSRLSRLVSFRHPSLVRPRPAEYSPRRPTCPHRQRSSDRISDWVLT